MHYSEKRVMIYLSDAKGVIVIISFLSNKIVKQLYSKGIIQEDQKPIYVYGFEIVISGLIGLSLILIISLVTGCLAEGLIFYVIFILTRTYTGGYHANSYLKCNIVFSCVCSAVLFLSKLLVPVYSIVIHGMILMIYLVAVLGLAPMENINKPMTNQEKSKNRKKCIILSIIWCGLALLTFRFSLKYSLVISLSLLSVAMLMIIEKFRKEKESDD